MADLEKLLKLKIAVEKSGDANTASRLSDEIDKLSLSFKELERLSEQANKQLADGQSQAAQETITRINRLRESNIKAEDSIERLGRASLKSGRQVEEAGKEAKKASEKVGEFNDGLDNLNQFGPEALGNLSGMVGQFADIAKTAGPAGVAIAALLGVTTAAVGAAAKAAQATADYAKEQSNLQKATGVSRELIASLSLGLEQNGGSADDAADSLLQLGGVISGAVADPASDAAQKFTDLGIAIVDSSGKARGIEAVFRDLDKAAQGAGLSQDKLVTLAGILGEDASKKLLPLLGNFEAGLVLENDVAANAEKFSKGLSDLEQKLKGVAIQVGGDFLESFNKVILDAQIAFESLSQDQNFKDGIDALIQATKDFISTAGPQLVEGLKLILQTLSRVSFVVQGVRESYVALRDAIFGKVEATQQDIKASQSQAEVIGKATRAAEAQRAELERTKKELEQNIAIREKLLSVERSLSDLRINAAKIAIEKGLGSELEITKHITEARIEQARKEEAAARKSLSAIEELRLKEAQKAGELANQTAEAILSSDAKVLEARKKSIDAGNALAQAQIQGERDLLALNLKSKQKLLDELVKATALSTARELALVEEAERSKQITKEESVKRQIEIEKQAIKDQIEGLDLVLQDVRLNFEQRIAFEKQRKDLINELSIFEIESSARVRDAQLADEQDVLEAKRARLDGEQAETERLIKHRIDLLRSAGASELEIAQLVDRAKKEALSKEIALINDRISLAQKDGSSQAEIQDLLNDRKQLENEIQDIIKGRTGAVASELNELAKGLQAADREFAGLVSRSDEFLQRSRSISDQLTAIAKEFEVTFDSDKATDTNLIEAQKQLEQFQKRLAETNQDLLTGSGIANSLLLAQKQTIEQAIDDLTNRVQVAQSRLAAEAAAERALQEEQKQRETQQKLISLYQEYLGERSELDEDYAEQKAALEKEIATLQFQSGIDLAAFQQMQQKALTEFDAKQAAEREKRAEQERLKKEDEAQKTVDNIKSINRKAREEESNERLKFLEERAKLEEQLASAEAAKSRAGSSSELAEAQTQIDKIKSDLAKLDGEEKARRERVKKRDEEIAKAQQAAQEKLKGAKTKEEIDAINEELEAVTKGINDRFKIEEDKFKKLKDLQGKATEETLRLIAEEFENKKKIAEEEEAALIESIRRKAAQQAAALAAQAEADRMAAEKARQDFIDRQNQELNDRKKAYEDKLNQLKEALDKEKKEYKEQSRQIEEEYKKSLSAINSTLQGLGNGVNQLFDDLLKKAGVTQEAINKIIASFPSGGNSNPSSTSSSSSNSASSSNNNSGPGNIFSSPNQGDNNGNAGSIGFNIQQAPNKQNNQGNQGQQNNPNSPPASPSSNSQSSPGSNTGNAAISASSNQANQNSEIEPSGNGQIDDTVPSKFNSPSEYVARMLKLQKNMFDSLGIDPSKPDTRNRFTTKKGKAATSRVSEIGKNITYQYADARGVGEEFRNRAILYFVPARVFYDGKTFSYSDSIPLFKKDVEYIASYIESLRPKEPSKFDDDLGTSATPVSPGSNPGDVNAPSSPNSPGGRGNNPSPRGPGSSNPVTPSVPNGGGLSDKERAVFAGRDRDAISGPGEGASAAGYVDPRTGRTTPDSTSPTNPSSSEPSLSQMMNMNMTQSNQIKNDFNIQITGLLSDPRTLSEIEEIVNRGIQAYGQQIQQEIRSQLNGMQFSS
jgi:colicin import membrane protein